MANEHPRQKITPGLPKLGAESAVALAGTLFSASLLVLTAIRAGPLWRDEVNTVNVAQMPSLRELWQNMPFESFPPLWPLLLRGCKTLGMADNDVAIRILGLYVGLAILISLWLCARWMGSRAPILTVGLLGSLPAFIFIAGGNRAYGLGACLLVLSFGTVWRLVEFPSRARIFTAGLICLLYVQCVYYDAVFLAAILAGGAAVALHRRAWKTLAALVAIGATSAVSLAIYLPIVRKGSAYVPLMQLPSFSFSTLWSKLGEAVAARSSAYFNPNGPEIRVWVLLVLSGLAAALFTRQSRTLPEPESKPARRPADLALFCSVSMVLGVAGMLAFLYRLHYLTQSWYYLQILIVCGISLDGILGANWPALRPWGLLRIGFIAAMMVHYGRAGWQEAHTRRSNVDLIAGILKLEASPGDFVVVNSAWEGITFHRYYHGAAYWATVPPVNSHLVHRNDLVFEDMCQTAPMTPVLRDIINALKEGHRVWMVGKMAPGLPGLPPPTCPPVRYVGTYFDYWNAQVSAALLDHAWWKKAWNVPAGGPVSCTENLPLTEFGGYRAGLAGPREANGRFAGAAHDQMSVRDAQQIMPEASIPGRSGERASRFELADGGDDLILVRLAEAVVERQPNEPFALFLRDGTASEPAAHLLADRRKVQGHVMKYAENAARLQKRYKCLARLQ